MKSAVLGSQLVSIVMPVYNGQKHLREAIISILNQTFCDFELIIVNDGSTDSTELIVKSFPDARIIYLKNDINLGLIKTLNKAISKAQGEYICRMDADDVSLPWRLEKQINHIVTHGLDFSASSVVKIDSNGRCIGVGPCFGAGKRETQFLLSITNPINHPTVIGKKEIFQNYLYNDTDHSRYVEDYELWGRLISSKCVGFGILPEPLLLYRRTGENITDVNLVELLDNTARISRGIQTSLFGKPMSDCFTSHFVLRKSVGSLRGSMRSIRELRNFYASHYSNDPLLDHDSMWLWIDYLTVQMILRLKTSWFTKLLSLAVYPVSAISVGFRNTAARIKYARLCNLAAL
jgi:glycosyltransferase involved in cell wall biosynthesis